MAGKRTFATAAVSAMRDTELTGLEWRLYLWVSLHDGRSMIKGGRGCYASNKTLFAEVGCNYSAGCRALSRLVERGHLLREQVGRSTRYRVLFPDPDNLQAGNTSDPAQALTGEAQTSCGPASGVAEIGCQPNSQTAEISPETERDYSPLSGELDAVETGGIDAVETARENGGAIGGKLARLGRRYRSDPASITDDDIAWLEGVVEAHHDDPCQLSRWAGRLLDKFDPKDLRGRGAGQ